MSAERRSMVQKSMGRPPWMLSATFITASCARTSASAWRSFTAQDAPPAASCGAPASSSSALSSSSKPWLSLADVYTTRANASRASTGSSSCGWPLCWESCACAWKATGVGGPLLLLLGGGTRSVLFTTSRDRPRTAQVRLPGPSPHNALKMVLSSAVHPSCASTTMSTMSAARAAARERSTPICSTLSTLSRIPAVSSSVSGTPPTTSPASSTSRVVPAMSVTIARSVRVHALSRLDLPTFGRPTMATCSPWRSSVPVCAVRSAASIPSARASTCWTMRSESMVGRSSSKSRRASSSASSARASCLSDTTAAPTPPCSPASAASAARGVRACSSSDTDSA
mmetsp:Transcript_27156/g.69106  ORF Transcript_27156/g.69106 Transcript_27156/m.69106 type:complete len:341 (-) Transcript_27156:637-1659(-)